MHFRSARIRNFRLLKDVDLELHPALSCLVGGNGAGKTSLLEALQVAGRGSSGKAPPPVLVSDDESAWQIEADLVSEDVRSPGSTVRIRWSESRLSQQINDRAASPAELVRLLPILMIDPLAHRLMEEGPAIRRRYIDWGVFHMEHRFHSAWLTMSRALRQRNAALRTGAAASELNAWDCELAPAAEEVARMRADYVSRLAEVATKYWQRLLDNTAWRLELRRGWREPDGYLDVLTRNHDIDRRLTYTRDGPHRAELLILGDNAQLKNRISRGQQKLLVASLILAQSELYRRQHGCAPVLLVDDFAAELSSDSQEKLLIELEAYAGQKVIATLDYSKAMRGLKDHSMFHMEHGHITTMTQKK